MGRPRLTDEEREARRRARNAFTFSDKAYSHFDPKVEGYGSEDEWVRIADDILSSKGVRRESFKKDNQLTLDLKALFLPALPETAAELKTAFRKALLKVHPDIPGGSHEATIAVLESFKRLSKHYQ